MGPWKSHVKYATPFIFLKCRSLEGAGDLSQLLVVYALLNTCWRNPTEFKTGSERPSWETKIRSVACRCFSNDSRRNSRSSFFKYFHRTENWARHVGRIIWILVFWKWSKGQAITINGERYKSMITDYFWYGWSNVKSLSWKGYTSL